MVREAVKEDINEILELYLYLHELEVPDINEDVMSTWQGIMDNPNYHIIVYEEDNKIVASCTCIIVPNMTRGVTPYALVENAVTHADYRCRGFAGQCFEYAKKLAEDAGCYKLMLITGSSDEGTHRLYKKLGYSSEGKTAYYQLLKEVNWKK